MDIDGICEDGTREPVMRQGEWAFDVYNKFLALSGAGRGERMFFSLVRRPSADKADVLKSLMRRLFSFLEHLLYYRNRPRKFPMIKNKKGLASLVEGLPSTYWLLWSGTLINRLGGFVIPFLTLYLTAQRSIPVSQARAHGISFRRRLLPLPTRRW